MNYRKPVLEIEPVKANALPRALSGYSAKVNALREVKSQTQEELDALLPSVLRK
jgi:response regulator of citrate/malate metabolism